MKTEMKKKEKYFASKNSDHNRQWRWDVNE